MAVHLPIIQVRWEGDHPTEAVTLSTEPEVTLISEIRNRVAEAAMRPVVILQRLLSDKQATASIRTADTERKKLQN